MNKVQQWKTKQRMLLGGIVFGLIGFVLILKVWQSGRFTPVEPVEIPSQPVLVLFNRYRGCECAMNVYEAAEWQVKGWPEEARSSVPVIVLDLDR